MRYDSVEGCRGVDDAFAGCAGLVVVLFDSEREQLVAIFRRLSSVGLRLAGSLNISMFSELLCAC